MVANQKYEIEEARRTTTKSKEDADKIRELVNQLESANKALSLAQLNGLFSFGSPYPTGLGQVKLGDPISQVDFQFSAAQIDKKRAGQWAVETQHAHFTSAYYYFDPREKDPKIKSISFYVDYKSPLRAVFKRRLIESLGLPSLAFTDAVFDDNRYRWSLANGILVEQRDQWLALRFDEVVTGSIEKTVLKKK